MRWATALAVERPLESALHAAADEIDQAFFGERPSLVVVFVSPEAPLSEVEDAPHILARRWPTTRLLGCTASGVIAAGCEVEEGPAVSLTAALLPGVRLTPFHIPRVGMPEPDEGVDAWRNLVPLDDDAQDPCFILLPDPFSCDSERLVVGLDAAWPRGIKIGGIASGASRPGLVRLLLNRQVYAGGVVGMALSGDIAVDTIVAQGCRPIGQPLFVTRASGNIIYELDGQPALMVLDQLFRSLGPQDQQLFRTSLHLGLAMIDQQQVYRPGDFLIRNIGGLDAETGALVAHATVDTHDVVQLHVRDSAASSSELATLLSSYRLANPSTPAGGLLFSCLGRGSGHYGQPNHDTDAFIRFIGDLPLGGFFCNGEIGPVGGLTFLHGYTSAFALFRPRG